MNSSSTCWLKPKDLKNLSLKNGIIVNITDFITKGEEVKKDDKKKKTKKTKKTLMKIYHH